MMINIDMVNAETLFEIATKTGANFDSHNVLRMAEECYEAGMILVLKGIAEDSFNKIKIQSSQYTIGLNDDAEKKNKELYDAFSEKDYALIQEYDALIEDYEAATVYDHYIQGFLDGYRYLAHRFACNGEGFNKKENK